MKIEWNLEGLGVPSDEAGAQAAKLEAELSRLGTRPSPSVAAPSEPEPEPEQPSPEAIDFQESPMLDPALVDRVYVAQANHDATITKVAEQILRIVANRLPPDVAECAIGRALLVMGTPDLVFATYEVEAETFPKRGDRVQEANGSIGTVVSVRSLRELIVKWDHEPKAMLSRIENLTPYDEEGQGNE